MLLHEEDYMTHILYDQSGDYTVKQSYHRCFKLKNHCFVNVIHKKAVINDISTECVLIWNHFFEWKPIDFIYFCYNRLTTFLPLVHIRFWQRKTRKKTYPYLCSSLSLFISKTFLPNPPFLTLKKNKNKSIVIQIDWQCRVAENREVQKRVFEENNEDFS